MTRLRLLFWTAALLFAAGLFGYGILSTETYVPLQAHDGYTYLAGGRGLTMGTDGVIVADAPLYTDTKDLYLDNPTTDDAGKVQITFATAVTITRIWCSTDTGTATIQFDERAEVTPNTGGTDVMTDALACDSDTAATADFANAAIAKRVPLNLDVDAVADTPTKLRIHIEFTKDD